MYRQPQSSALELRRILRIVIPSEVRSRPAGEREPRRGPRQAPVLRLQGAMYLMNL
jgi:hypothetical protein